jgi:GNAT superfamily N-acetyltransferase
MEDEAMTIRLARESDVGTLVGLYASFFKEDVISTPLEAIEGNLRLMMSDHRAGIFVAEEEGRIIGFSSGSLTFGVEFGCSAELEDLYVIPSKRGAGWARKLAASVLDWAVGEGANEIFLVITPEAEEGQSLTTFYENLGFQDSRRITMIRAKETRGRVVPG